MYRRHIVQSTGVACLQNKTPESTMDPYTTVYLEHICQDVSELYHKMAVYSVTVFVLDVSLKSYSIFMFDFNIECYLCL